MSFLPENYESPRTSNFYMKMQEGENRIRILTRPIMGWEDWQDKKPIRFTYDKKPAKSLDPKKPIRHFWAFVVFNYVEQKIQIFHITQATIRKALEGLCRDQDWGDPYHYDIKIIKSGEGVDTEYHINPVPHKPIDQEVVEMFNENRCNLEALFTSEDPFASHWDTYTPLGSSEVIEKKESPSNKTISHEQAEQILVLLENAESEYVKSLWNTLKKQNINKISELPTNLFDRVKIGIMNNQKKSENDLDSVFPLSSDEM